MLLFQGRFVPVKRLSLTIREFIALGEYYKLGALQNFHISDCLGVIPLYPWTTL